MTAVSSIASNRNENISWCPPPEYFECSSSPQEMDQAEYLRLTSTPTHQPNATRFKNPEKSKPMSNGDRLALGAAILSGSLLLGGPVGLGLGALFLAGCFQELPDVSGPDGVEVTGNATAFSDPSIAWSGSVYGISWVGMDSSNNSQLFFARLDSEGHKIDGEQQITSGSSSPSSPMLVWNTSTYEFALVWDDNGSDYSKIVFTRIDESGNKVGGDVPVITYDFYIVNNYGFRLKYPTIAWNDVDREYGISGAESFSGTLVFVSLNPDGPKIGSPRSLSQRFSSNQLESPTIIWSGREYGLGWLEQSINEENHFEETFLFNRFGSEGNRLGKDETMSRGNLAISPLVWTGSQYSIAWFDGSDDGIYFETISKDGSRIHGPSRIADSARTFLGDGDFAGVPSLAWNGEEYGMTWVNNEPLANNGLPFPGIQSINFTRLDTAGNRVGDIIPVTNNKRELDRDPVSFNPLLAWTGQGYGVLWTYWGGDHLELRFARIGENF